MDRLEMSQEIAKRVPMLAEYDREEWTNAEHLQADFVDDYPVKRIPSLTLDEYVIGKGAKHRSFCYRLEREMDSLGRILGATAFKFGVYFGHTKSDATDRYRFARRWGDNLEDAFVAVKTAIVDVLQAATNGDWAAVATNALSPMFKGKLLFIYQPNEFAPIYSREHLEHFAAELDLSGSFQCEADMQRALMRYRAGWPELVAQPATLYMRLLYEIFGYPPKKTSTTATILRVPLLDEAVKGARFISEMPESLVAEASLLNIPIKIDHEKRLRQFKRIGDRGEAVVVAVERERLVRAGKPELAALVKCVSQEDDSAGYDVLSFEEDGTSRPIEVKATTGFDLARGFYITRNEVEKSKSEPNYHLYIVFAAMSKQPRILPLKRPKFDGVDFVLLPVAFQVALAADNNGSNQRNQPLCQ
jgi:hypothetical protein